MAVDPQGEHIADDEDGQQQRRRGNRRNDQRQQRHAERAHHRQPALRQPDGEGRQRRQRIEQNVGVHSAVSGPSFSSSCGCAQEFAQRLDHETMIVALRNARHGDGADAAGAFEIDRKTPAMRREFHADRARGRR